VVSITPRPRFTPRERAPGTHCTGGWVGPRAGLDAEITEQVFALLPLWIKPPFLQSELLRLFLNLSLQ
jgi:hypothetical protein